MKKISVLVCGRGEITSKFLEGLSLNSRFIKEVIFPEDVLSKKSDIDFDFHAKFIDRGSQNNAQWRNKLLKEASSELVLFVDLSTYLDEDYILELLEEKEDADVVFGNPIIIFNDQEEVVNLEQVYGKEKTLLTSLSLESFVPEYGVLMDKKIFEKEEFDEYLDDFEFYDFLYKNISWLKLKLSELSYFSQEMKDSFIDTAWRSFVLRKIIQMYDWKEDIFPYLSWKEKPEIAKATALTIIGEKLAEYLDFLNANMFYREALLSFHNKKSLLGLINSLKQMGEFEKIYELLSVNQGFSKEEVDRELGLIDSIKKLINELERMVEEGKYFEVLASISEVTEVYKGAPIYNILGVIHWSGKDLENAYRYFYKAVTMNPVDKDFYFNLLNTANSLGREKKVEKLFSILLTT